MKLKAHQFHRHGRLKLSSGTLFWQEMGDGDETLVFLHGSWHDSGQWAELMPSLGAQHHCLAPDLLGFGESQAVSDAYSVELQVETLAAFLEALRIQRCYLIGHSLGAWVAGRYALRYPDQVRGLAVIAPEGVAAPAVDPRWRSQRWIARRFSPGFALLRLGTPLIQLLGGRAWLRQIQAQRQQLLGFPATCQTFLGRRPAAIQAEEMTALPADLPVLGLASTAATPTETALTAAFLALTPTGTIHPVSADANDLGLDPESTAALLSRFCQPHPQTDNNDHPA